MRIFLYRIVAAMALTASFITVCFGIWLIYDMYRDTPEKIEQKRLLSEWKKFCELV